MTYPLLLLNFDSCANRTLSVDKEGEREGQIIAEDKKRTPTILLVQCSFTVGTLVRNGGDMM